MPNTLFGSEVVMVEGSSLFRHGDKLLQAGAPQLCWFMFTQLTVYIYIYIYICIHSKLLFTIIPTVNLEIYAN